MYSTKKIKRFIHILSVAFRVYNSVNIIFRQLKNVGQFWTFGRIE